MKISSASQYAAASLVTKNAAKEKISGATEAAEVNISTVASNLMVESSPVDSARVSEIKNAIAEGRFKINPEAIASGLLATAQDLVARQNKA